MKMVSREAAKTQSVSDGHYAIFAKSTQIIRTSMVQCGFCVPASGFLSLLPLGAQEIKGLGNGQQRVLANMIDITHQADMCGAGI